jgi:hypothetical protein
MTNEPRRKLKRVLKAPNKVITFAPAKRISSRFYLLPGSVKRISGGRLQTWNAVFDHRPVWLFNFRANPARSEFVSFGISGISLAGKSKFGQGDFSVVATTEINRNLAVDIV